MRIDILAKPFSLGNVTIPNRVVMAPMTRSKSPQHVPTQEVADYYQRRAKGGIGLIITEGTVINHPAGHAYPDVPNIFGHEALSGWKRVAEQVHAEGGLIFPQLWHTGSVRQRIYHENPGVDNPKHCCQCDHSDIPGMGPSAIAHPYVDQSEKPKALSETDIHALIQAFAMAALDAKNIGFDGIELHAAHGYLIDQFFWQVTNERTDKYGGKTLAERTRFAVEIIEAVREAVGPHFPISFRISQWKLGAYDTKMAATPKELEAFLRPLAKAGVDIFHCSTRRFLEPEFSGSSLNLAGWVKQLSGLPTITVGSIGLDNDFVNTFKGRDTRIWNQSLEIMLEKLAVQEYDLIAVGRMLLSNPDWYQKIKKGRTEELVPFSKEFVDKLY